MSKLRVNFGGCDYQVNMTVQEFEALYASQDEFIVLPLMLFGQPHATLRVRPAQIKYYFEEL